MQSHRDHHMVAFLLLCSAAQWAHPQEQQLSPLAAEEQVRASVTFPGCCLSDGQYSGCMALAKETAFNHSLCFW